jgi:hypothetical protein
MALIAKMTGADVLPFAVRYERPLRFRSRVVVRFGRLIPQGSWGSKRFAARPQTGDQARLGRGFIHAGGDVR